MIFSSSASISVNHISHKLIVNSLNGAYAKYSGVRCSNGFKSHYFNSNPLPNNKIEIEIELCFRSKCVKPIEELGF